MSKLEIKDLLFDKTCNSCPEQYDVYNSDTNECIAYFRLRHGKLSVTPVFKKEILWEYEGDIYTKVWENSNKGELDEEERDDIFNKVMQSIVDYYNLKNDGLFDKPYVGGSQFIEKLLNHIKILENDVLLLKHQVKTLKDIQSMSSKYLGKIITENSKQIQ